MKKLIQHKIFGLKWSTILLGILFLLLKQEMQAQVISNNGVYVSISGGTVVSIDAINNDNATTLANEGTINISTINNAGTTRGNGTYNIAGNFTNTGTFISNTSTVNMNGTSAQTLPGSIFFNNLIIDNAAGVTMAGNITVGSTLNLNTGNLKIGANTLTLNGSAIRVSGNLVGSHTSSIAIAGTAGSLFFDQVSTNNYLKNFTINNGASATLGNALNITGGTGANSEGVLTVSGTGLLTTGGLLTIKSNNNGTAQIAAGNSSGGYISGNVTVERFIPQNTFKGWRLLGSPTSGQTIKNAWQEGQTGSMSNTKPGFGTMITFPGASLSAVQANGFDTLSPGASLFYYDAATDNLIRVANTNSTNINTYPGYFFYIRGNRSLGQFGGPNSNATAATSTTLRSTGSLYQGNQPAINVSTAFGLINNPFASRIDMRNIILSGMVNAFQVWDPKLAGGYGFGAYQTFTKSGTDYLVTPGGGSYGVSGSVQNYLESGSAFFVQTSGGTGSITIPETAKVGGSSVVNRPAGILAENSRLITNLYVMDSTHSLADGNMIFFDAGNSNAIDIDDVRKSPNFGENFGIIKFNTDLVVERRPLLSNSDTILFNMNQLKQLQYQIEILPTGLDQPGILAFLEDNYLNSSTPVRLNAATTYNFTVTAAAGSKAANRFKIIFRPQGTLPVTFTSIKATQANKNIAIEWKVSSQINLTGYEVEKSTDGSNFTRVATQQVMETNSTTVIYKWLDENAVNGTNYYRIKSIDNNGRFQYSEIVKVVLDNDKPGITVSPNPVKGNLVNLQFTNQPAGNYSIRVINAEGQMMYGKTMKYYAGSVSQTMSLPSTVIKGIYQLHLLLPDNTTQVIKLMVD